jgi:carbon-monoxide dehydrogenase large subunit
MNAPFDPTLLMNEKFAVGQPVSRKEDPVLLRGEGRYSDDLNLAGQLYAVVVRSRMAHGEIRSMDASMAREMPGVDLIVTAADRRISTPQVSRTCLLPQARTETAHRPRDRHNKDRALRAVSF